MLGVGAVKPLHSGAIIAALVTITLLLAYGLRSPSWEYKVELIGDGDWRSKADYLGGQGWEIVSTRRVVDGKEPATECVMKRRR